MGQYQIRGELGRIPGALSDRGSFCQNLRVMGAPLLAAVLSVVIAGATCPMGVLSVPPAKGRLLVASRTLQDPNFAQTVVLLLKADRHGAMGLVINRPTAVRLSDALPDLPELRSRGEEVFLGGPVQQGAMLLLVRGGQEPPGSARVMEDVYVTGRLSTLKELLNKGGPGVHLRAYAGYAGWGPGQLEREIARGDWLVGSSDAGSIFDLAPDQLWQRWLERLTGSWT